MKSTYKYTRTCSCPSVNNEREREQVDEADMTASCRGSKHYAISKYNDPYLHRHTAHRNSFFHFCSLVRTTVDRATPVQYSARGYLPYRPHHVAVCMGDAFAWGRLSFLGHSLELQTLPHVFNHVSFHLGSTVRAMRPQALQFRRRHAHDRGIFRPPHGNMYPN